MSPHVESLAKQAHVDPPCSVVSCCRTTSLADSFAPLKLAWRGSADRLGHDRHLGFHGFQKATSFGKSGRYLLLKFIFLSFFLSFHPSIHPYLSMQKAFFFRTLCLPRSLSLPSSLSVCFFCFYARPSPEHSVPPESCETHRGCSATSTARAGILQLQDQQAPGGVRPAPAKELAGCSASGRRCRTNHDAFMMTERIKKTRMMHHLLS